MSVYHGASCRASPCHQLYLKARKQRHSSGQEILWRTCPYLSVPNCPGGEILVHSLHPTIFVAHTKSDEPRVAILFAVSAEAAAHIDPYKLYTSSQ